MTHRARPRGLRVLCVVGLVLGGCTSDTSPEARFIDNTRPTVGMHTGLPGVSFQPDEGSGFSGIDVLVKDRVEEGLGFDRGTLRVSSTASDQRDEMLMGDKADMVIASYSITPDRMTKVDFAGPYLTTRQGVLVGPENLGVRSRKDLKGKTVCTWGGTTSEAPLENLRAEGLIANVEDTRATARECVDAVVAGDVDAFSTDLTILYGFVEANPGAGLRVVPDTFIGTAQYYGIGIPKGHRKDCERLKAFLKDYVESPGWVQDIRVSLPALDKAIPDWPSRYKPKPEDIDRRSCKDKAGLPGHTSAAAFPDVSPTSTAGSG